MTFSSHIAQCISVNFPKCLGKYHSIILTADFLILRLRTSEGKTTVVVVVVEGSCRILRIYQVIKSDAGILHFFKLS